jgi:predicted hydrocarbon binding protein
MIPPIDISERNTADHRLAIPMPNGYMRAALEAIEEIAGQTPLNVMLRFAGLEAAIAQRPPDNLDFDAGYVFRDYSNLNHAIIQFYGRSGKVHAIQIGRRSARWMIENHPLFGFAGIAFKLMPREMAMRMSLNSTLKGFRELYKKANFDITINLAETETHFVWSSPDCPCCVGKQSTEPICWIWTAGFIEGATFVTEGRGLAVEQTQCIAAGDRQCTWLINKTPPSESYSPLF